MILHPWETVGGPRLLDTPVSATVGVFDGVHLGHQFLLEELVRNSSVEISNLVVTFRDSPKKILNPHYPGDLMTWDEKIKVISQAGVEHMVVIDFSHAFSRIAGRDFFNSLKRSFVFSKLVLGWDFSFGKNSSTTAADLGWLADPETRLTILPPYTMGGKIVSSSMVREAVMKGDFDRVRILLGRPYILPISSSQVRWVDGFCRVERTSLVKLLPSSGSYPAKVGGHDVLVAVEKDLVSWESPPGLRFSEVVFV